MSALCEHCLQGYILSGTPSGMFDGTAYFHPAPSPDSKRAVVLLTDIFGLKLVNAKLIADQYSERLKCDVWVPDYFNGTPAALFSLHDFVLLTNSQENLPSKNLN